jgi:hypothetical protein
MTVYVTLHAVLGRYISRGRNAARAKPNPMEYPRIMSTDLNDLRLLGRFGECQVMTHPVAKRLFISSLIIKSFRGYDLPLDRGSYT